MFALHILSAPSFFGFLHYKGSFNNYVDKMRGGGGQKCLFLSTQGAYCFHMEVKVAVLNAISQNYNFFEVKLVPYAWKLSTGSFDRF